MRPGAAARRSASSGVCSTREVLELGQGRLQLGEEVVEEVEVAREVVAALGRGRGRVARLLDEVDDVLAALGEPPMIRSESALRSRMIVFWSARIFSHLLELGAAPARRGGSPR